jgi:hypothetical protein
MGLASKGQVPMAIIVHLATLGRPTPTPRLTLGLTERHAVAASTKVGMDVRSPAA